MRRVVVLGGSGFIGTALCRRLEHAIIPFKIIDLKPSRSFPRHCIIADIRKTADLRAHLEGDVVVNLAAVHRDDVRDRNLYYDTNVQGNRNVTQIAHEKRIGRVIFTSSVAVYGFASPGTDEQGTINPFNDYGISKFEGEEVLRSWRNQDPERNELVIIRPTVVFGEGNRGNVYNLLNQIATDRFLMIGGGDNRKSMAYVENVAAFLLAGIVSSQKHGLYNYVDTPDLTMNELVTIARAKLFGQTNVGKRIPYRFGLAAGYLADAVARITRTNLPISSIRVRKFCADTAFSSAKNNLDNFVPDYTLHQGLDRTLEAEFISPDLRREIFFSE